MSAESALVRSADPVAASGNGAIRLSHRWLRGDSEKVLSDYAGRTDLPFPLRPGERVILPVRVELPAAPGLYWLQWDFIHEGVGWFESRGSDRLLTPVSVHEGRNVPRP